MRWTRCVVLFALVVVVALSGTAAFATHTGDRDCPDFANYEEAKAHFDAHSGDPDNLDADGDGVPCEDLPGAPEGAAEETPETGSVSQRVAIAGFGSIALGALALLAVRRREVLLGRFR